jgi:thioredoxin reductase (NADPH)
MNGGMKNHRRLIILGSDPACWTAAVYGARANLKPLLIRACSRAGSRRPLQRLTTGLATRVA